MSPAEAGEEAPPEADPATQVSPTEESASNADAANVESRAELSSPATEQLADELPETTTRPPTEQSLAVDDVELPAVQVCVRIRPLLGWERKERHECQCLQVRAGRGGAVTIVPPPEDDDDKKGGDSAPSRASSRPPKPKSFRFNAVFGQSSTQQEVWDQMHLASLVGKVVQGFHATVFAYGQTGSGKTHTMEGFTYESHSTISSSAPCADGRKLRALTKSTPPEQLGVVPRAVEELFARVAQLREQCASMEDGMTDSFTVKVSFMQVYKERVFDLLNPAMVTTSANFGGPDSDAAGNRMRWDAMKRRFYVENLFEYECGSAEEVLQHYAVGVRQKQVAATAMNHQSSRSHTILLVTLARHTGTAVTEDAAMEAGNQPPAAVGEVVSTLALVDLAGSERAAASGDRDSRAGADRFNEAVKINQSLFVLRRVITALSKRHAGEEDVGEQHVPYRESKLTSLLQHAIGGNGFMLMLACLSPADRHFEENLSTLKYASQASLIKNDPILNLDPKDRLIQQLREQLEAAHAYILEHLGLEELPKELQELAAASGGRSTLGARGRGGGQRRRGCKGGRGRPPPEPCGPGPPAWSVDPRKPARRERGEGDIGVDSARGHTSSAGSQDRAQLAGVNSATRGVSPSGRLPAQQIVFSGKAAIPTSSKAADDKGRSGLPPIVPTPRAGGNPAAAMLSMYCQPSASFYKSACRAEKKRSASGGGRLASRSPLRLSNRSASASELPRQTGGETLHSARSAGDPEETTRDARVENFAWGPQHEAKTRRDLETQLQEVARRNQELEVRLASQAAEAVSAAVGACAEDTAQPESTRDTDSSVAPSAQSTPPAPAAPPPPASKAVVGEGALAKWAKYANKK